MRKTTHSWETVAALTAAKIFLSPPPPTGDHHVNIGVDK